MADIIYQIGDLFFSWDESKNHSNFEKHGVAFQEAATCWLDHLAIETFDDAHSTLEARWLMSGKSDARRLLTCWYTERNFGDQELIRIIGARPATKLEKDIYYETKKKR